MKKSPTKKPVLKKLPTKVANKAAAKKFTNRSVEPAEVCIPKMRQVIMYYRASLMHYIATNKRLENNADAAAAVKLLAKAADSLDKTMHSLKADNGPG